jgi:hypothetical protein
MPKVGNAKSEKSKKKVTGDMPELLLNLSHNKKDTIARVFFIIF